MLCRYLMLFYLSKVKMCHTKPSEFYGIDSSYKKSLQGSESRGRMMRHLSNPLEMTKESSHHLLLVKLGFMHRCDVWVSEKNPFQIAYPFVICFMKAIKTRLFKSKLRCYEMKNALFSEKSRENKPQEECWGKQIEPHAIDTCACIQHFKGIQCFEFFHRSEQTNSQIREPLFTAKKIRTKFLSPNDKLTLDA